MQTDKSLVISSGNNSYIRNIEINNNKKISNS